MLEFNNLTHLVLFKLEGNVAKSVVGRRRSGEVVTVRHVQCSLSLPENMRDAVDDICDETGERRSGVVSRILAKSAEIKRRLKGGD